MTIMQWMKNNKKVLIILGVIVLFGFGLRIYNLGRVSFSGDEFLDMNSAYGFHKTGVWQAWDFNLEKVSDSINAPRDERAWIYKWQVAQLFKFLPPVEGVARLMSVFWGVVSIILMYFAGLYFSKRKSVGLLSALLFALSITAILFDRKFRMYAMFSPVFLAFSWCAYHFFESVYRGRNAMLQKINSKLGVNIMFLLPALLLGILSLSLHALTANIVVVILAYLIIQMILQRKVGWKNKYAIYFGLIFFAIVVAQLLFAARLGSLTAGLSFFNSNYEYFGKIFEDYSYWMIPAAFLLLGSYALLRNEKERSRGLWVVVSFFAVLLMAIFVWHRNAGVQYIFFVESFEMIIIASGIVALADYLKHNLINHKTKAFAVVVIGSVLMLPNYAYFFLNDNTYHASLHSQTPNFQKAYAYVLKNRKATDVLITRNFRNYYFSGAKIETITFGGELATADFKLNDLLKAMSQHESGWLVYTDNDTRYITKEARNYMEENLEKVTQASEPGVMIVYRWQR